jgi:hypothetical protein
MTSLAFILGVVPLAVATGAGAEMRQSLGTAVIFGMLIRAFADNSAATYDFLVAHGVIFIDRALDAIGGNSVPLRCTPPSWTGPWCRPASQPIPRCGPPPPRATG